MYGLNARCQRMYGLNARCQRMYGLNARCQRMYGLNARCQRMYGLNARCQRMYGLNARCLIFSEIGTCTHTIYATCAPRGKIKGVTRVSMRLCTGFRQHIVANVRNHTYMYMQTRLKERKSALAFATWAIFAFECCACDLKLSGRTVHIYSMCPKRLYTSRREMPFEIRNGCRASSYLT